MEISVLCDVKPLLGEGPVWDVERQRLWFIDSLGCRVFCCTETGSEIRAWTVPSPIGSMALRQSGGAIVALRDGFHALDFDSGALEFLVDPESDLLGNRLNDGKVDPRGRFLCGSMDTGETEPTGTLWRLDPDLSLHPLETGIICSNGPCFSPSGEILYFADSFSGEISAFDYDVETGTAANRRRFAAPPADRGGAPDGATVDAEGCVWSVSVFDGRIHRYTPDGAIDRVIEMPVCKVTSLAFGGPDLATLFVTSMAEPPLPKYPGDGPLRGATFRIDGLGVTGRPEPRFAG